MLGDHGDVDKSKPWEGSAHVPLMCKGPGIAKGQTVNRPVATMDMAGTFLDFADAKPAAGMTTQSFRSLLEGNTEATDYRSYVSSGLNNFRAQNRRTFCLRLVLSAAALRLWPRCASRLLTAAEEMGRVCVQAWWCRSFRASSTSTSAAWARESSRAFCCSSCPFLLLEGAD